jgi:hypothetical protein
VGLQTIPSQSRGLKTPLTLDRTAFELLGGINDAAEGMPVIRVAGQRFGVEHELATGDAGGGGDDRSFDAELVGRGGLPLADAFDIGAWKE